MTPQECAIAIWAFIQEHPKFSIFTPVMSVWLFGFVYVKLSAFFERRNANCLLDGKLVTARELHQSILDEWESALLLNRALPYTLTLSLGEKGTHIIEASGYAWKGKLRYKAAKFGPGKYLGYIDGAGHRNERFEFEVGESEALGSGWVKPKPERVRVVPIPSMGGIATRVDEDHIYYDREPVVDGFQVYFFQNAFQDQFGNPKTQSDCNLYGNGGSIPRGYHKKITGISLVPDNDVSDEVISKLRDNAKLELIFGRTPHKSWPARSVMADKKSAQNEPVFKFKTPIELCETESFGFSLSPIVNGRSYFPTKGAKLPRFMLMLFGPCSKPLAC